MSISIRLPVGKNFWEREAACFGPLANGYRNMRYNDANSYIKSLKPCSLSRAQKSEIVSKIDVPFIEYDVLGTATNRPSFFLMKNWHPNIPMEDRKTEARKVLRKRMLQLFKIVKSFKWLDEVLRVDVIRGKVRANTQFPTDQVFNALSVAKMLTLNYYNNAYNKYLDKGFDLKEAVTLALHWQLCADMDGTEHFTPINEGDSMAGSVGAMSKDDVINFYNGVIYPRYKNMRGSFGYPKYGSAPVDLFISNDHMEYRYLSSNGTKTFLLNNGSMWTMFSKPVSMYEEKPKVGLPYNEWVDILKNLEK